MTPFKCQKEWTIVMTTECKGSVLRNSKLHVHAYVYVYKRYVCIDRCLMMELCIYKDIYFQLYSLLLKVFSFLQNVIIEIQLKHMYMKRVGKIVQKHKWTHISVWKNGRKNNFLLLIGFLGKQKIFSFDRKSEYKDSICYLRTFIKEFNQHLCFW